MKNIYYVLVISSFTLSLFGQEIEIIGKTNKTECAIIKIDSIGSFYVIDVLSNENKYKIVSRKIQTDCSNLHKGETYMLSLSPMFPIIASHHFEYDVGLGTYVTIDWGHNLYIAQELYGLCYEIDTVKLARFKNLINQQSELEAAILTIYFFYNTNKGKHSIISDFYKKTLNNSAPFALSETKGIPVYVSPKNGKVKYELFSDSISRKVFKGEVLYRYKKFYFIQGYYDSDNEVAFLGWINKKYLPQVDDFGNRHKKKKQNQNDGS